MKKYTIAKIYEQDFGCEGRMEGQPMMYDVVLQDEAGEQHTVQMTEEYLDENNLDEGDIYWEE